MNLEKNVVFSGLSIKHIKNEVCIFIRVDNILLLMAIWLSMVLQNISEVRDSGVVKKSGSETAPKRPRNENPSPLPAFKVQ